MIDPGFGGLSRKGDADYPHLSAFLDSELRSNDARGGILGATIGTSWGCVGALTGILVGGLQVPAEIGLTIPMLFGLVATGVATRWYYASMTTGDRELDKLRSKTRKALWELHMRRYRGGLVGRYSAEALRLLDEGARHWMRCRAAIDSDAWKAAPGASWSAARSKAGVAVDSAMRRLLLQAGWAESAESLPQSTRTTLDEMRQLADECVALVDQAATLAQRGADSASSSLRDVLSDLRMIREAQNELDEDQKA